MKCTPRLIDLNVHIVVALTLSLLLVVNIAGCSSSKKNMKISSDARKSQANFVSQNTRKKQPHKNVNVKVSTSKKYKMALMMMEDGDYQGAKSLFQQVVNEYPKLKGAYINLGIISLKQNDYEQAESQFQAAIKHNPDDALLYNYLGVAYRQQGRFSEANQAYKQSLSLDDSIPSTYLNLGILNDLYLGNYLEAQQHYKKYQQLNPDNKKINAWLLDLNSRIQARTK